MLQEGVCHPRSWPCPFLSQQFSVLIGSGCFATKAHLGDGRDSLHFEFFFRQMRFELSLRSVGKEKRGVQVMPCQTISSIKCYVKYLDDSGNGGSESRLLREFNVGQGGLPRTRNVQLG